MVGYQFNYSYGEDFVYANKRRHGGKEERNADLLIELEAEEADASDVAIRSEKVIRTFSSPAAKMPIPWNPAASNSLPHQQRGDLQIDGVSCASPGRRPINC